MKASFFLGNGEFEVREKSISKPTGRNILVKNMACGVCGSDAHIVKGGSGSASIVPPIVLGHEYAGEVIEIGEGVTTVKVGDRVAIDPNIYCGMCDNCRIGKKHLCSDIHAVGVTQDGGFQEYSEVPEAQAFLMDAAISYEAAAMAEPVSCCLHGTDRANIRTGDAVCIVGGGAIGLIMLQLALLSGAEKVIVSEPNPARRALASRLCAAAINPMDEDCYEQFLALTNNKGADVVIECAGNQHAIRDSLRFAKRGATIVLFSVPDEAATIPLQLFDVYKKELTIKGSFINPDTFLRAMNLLNSRRLDVESLITHVYGIEDMPQAIAMQMSSESIKVMIKPHGRKS